MSMDGCVAVTKPRTRWTFVGRHAVGSSGEKNSPLQLMKRRPVTRLVEASASLQSWKRQKPETRRRGGSLEVWTEPAPLSQGPAATGGRIAWHQGRWLAPAGRTFFLSSGHGWWLGLPSFCKWWHVDCGWPGDLKFVLAFQWPLKDNRSLAIVRRGHREREREQVTSIDNTSTHDSN